MAVAIASNLPPPPQQLANVTRFNSPARDRQRRTAPPLVVDLSSLWAGPLCSHLLQRAGSRVIKVEGRNRLDGARTGSPAFYQLLNQGKESLALDFDDPHDIQTLKQLIGRADIVIEGSRPRALRNVGIMAEEHLHNRPGLTWLSITGYGRNGINEERIGFGDDAAAGAGLCKLMETACGQLEMAGDAIADPLTGIHAALQSWQSYLDGGSKLIALSLQDTVSYCLHQELQTDQAALLESCRQWLRLGNRLDALFPTGPRQPDTAWADPGQHNQDILQELTGFA